MDWAWRGAERRPTQHGGCTVPGRKPNVVFHTAVTLTSLQGPVLHPHGGSPLDAETSSAWQVGGVARLPPRPARATIVSCPPRPPLPPVSRFASCSISRCRRAAPAAG